MADWSMVSSLATAAGTLVLAIATFVAVRSANRSARIAEYSMQIGIRPLLMPSRLDDSQQKIMWGDEHWALLSGAGATAEVADDNAYLDVAPELRLRHRGDPRVASRAARSHDHHPHATPEEFRPQTRDLYVPGDDIGFWQGAIRNREDPEYADLVEAIGSRRVFAVEFAVHRSRRRATRDRHVRGRADGRVSVAVLDGPTLEPRPARSSVAGGVKTWSR